MEQVEEYAGGWARAAGEAFGVGGLGPVRGDLA